MVTYNNTTDCLLVIDIDDVLFSLINNLRERNIGILKKHVDTIVLNSIVYSLNMFGYFTVNYEPPLTPRSFSVMRGRNLIYDFYTSIRETMLSKIFSILSSTPLVFNKAYFIRAITVNTKIFIILTTER